MGKKALKAKAPVSDVGHAGGKLAAFCRTLAGTTEDVKWGDDLVFSVGGKMYAAFDLDDEHEFGFKASEEDFWRLTQKPGIIPAPYAARFFWVKVNKRGALRAAESRQYLQKAHALVALCLPRRVREEILGTTTTPKRAAPLTRRRAKK